MINCRDHIEKLKLFRLLAVGTHRGGRNRNRKIRVMVWSVMEVSGDDAGASRPGGVGRHVGGARVADGNGRHGVDPCAAVGNRDDSRGLEGDGDPLGDVRHQEHEKQARCASHGRGRRRQARSRAGEMAQVLRWRDMAGGGDALLQGRRRQKRGVGSPGRLVDLLGWGLTWRAGLEA